MIQTFIDRFLENKPKLVAIFAAAHPNGYKEILQATVSIITLEDDHRDFNPDPSRIHEIDDGEYQGTLVYVIGAKGYQPSDYWYTKVSYGSCSGCDILANIRERSDKTPTEEQVKDYITLALHMVEAMKKMGKDSA